MSIRAVDTPSVRDSDRLTAFLSEIEVNEPVDNFFGIYPLIDELKRKAEFKDGGRQIFVPIEVGENDTLKYYSDYDVFETRSQSTAKSVLFPLVNLGGSLQISKEELDEVRGKNHAIYALLAFKRSSLLKSAMKHLNSDLHGTSIVAGQPEPIGAIIDSSGSCGGLSASDESNWAAHEIAAGGSFDSVGIEKMRKLYIDIVADKGVPKVIITTQDIIESYEKDYAGSAAYPRTDGVIKVGATDMVYKNVPLRFDPDCASQVLYMIDTDYLKMAIDKETNFVFDPFKEPTNQRAQVSLFAVRFAVICSKRNAQGKITGLS